MTEQDIKNFIAQTENDLRVAKEFYAMWQRRNGAGAASSVAPQGVQPPLPIQQNGGPESDYGANKRAVVAAIEKCPIKYSIYDVEKVLASEGHPLPRGAISQALNRLSKAGEIEQVEKGSGRRPAFYHKLGGA